MWWAQTLLFLVVTIVIWNLALVPPLREILKEKNYICVYRRLVLRNGIYHNALCTTAILATNPDEALTILLGGRWETAFEVEDKDPKLTILYCGTSQTIAIKVILRCLAMEE